jgi:hypothetical protein
MKKLGIIVIAITLLAFFFVEAETVITPPEKLQQDYGLKIREINFLNADMAKKIGKFQEDLGRSIVESSVFKSTEVVQGRFGLVQEKIGTALRNIASIKNLTTEKIVGLQEGLGNIIVALSTMRVQDRTVSFQEQFGLIFRDVHARNADVTLTTPISTPVEFVDNPEYLKFVIGGAQVRYVAGHFAIPFLALATMLVFLFSIGSLPRISEYVENKEEGEEREEDYTYWKRTRAA